MHPCKPVHNPTASGTCISLMDAGLLSDASEYKNMVGAIQCLTVSQFMDAPHITHLHYM